jgi:hypothetical protein
MKRLITFMASGLAFSASPAFAQTADHAPTKPAADAAARYDRSVEQSAPPNAAKGSGDSSSGASTGTNPSATRNHGVPADGETVAPKSDKSK